MQPRYRSEYPGEFVVLETKWSQGKKIQNREWISNPIENQHISGRAACIGSNFDKQKFDYTRLQRHRGGLLGSKKLQTYGVGNIALEMQLDFSVETNKNRLKQLIELNYTENNIVYTSAKNCIESPGEFYLIPYNPKLLDLATILYLAAFDGHQEIFLHGYNNEVNAGNPDWINQINTVFLTYNGIQFFIVGEKTNISSVWLDNVNVEPMTHRKFISYCDV